MRTPPALPSVVLASTLVISALARADDPDPPWESSPSAALSADGRWFACTVDAGPGRSRIIIRDTDGGHRREVDDAREPTFTADSKSLIYSVTSPEGLEYVVRDLKAWSTKRSFRGPSVIAATADARYLVIKGPPGMINPGTGERPPDADDVFSYSLIEDRITAIGPASLHKVSGDGRLAALAKAGADGQTALDVLHLGEIEARRVLEIRGEVTALNWGDDHRSLALVVAQDKPDGTTDDVLIVVDDVTAKTPKVRSILPEKNAAWPKGGYLDPAAHQIGTAGAIVYFRVRDGAVAAPRPPLAADVEIHRATDEVRYDSITDSLQEGAAETGVWTFAWIPEDGRMIRVTDKGQTSAILLRGGRIALVPRGGGHPRPPDFPPIEWDVVDPRAGTRASLGMGPVAGVSPSRTGRYVTYFDRGHWWAYDTKDGSRRDLTPGLGPVFEAEFATGRGTGRPIGAPEWLEADGGIVAHDKDDAWLLHPDGTPPRRLTRGRERGQVCRLAAANRSRSGNPDRLYDFQFLVMETASKHSGYLLIRADGEERVIAFGPWAFGKFARARDAERFVFQRESDDSPPNYFTATARGDDARLMTDMNPRHATSLPPKRELIQYRDRHEAALQGTLIYPVGHNPAKAYPMVVSIYGIRSDDHFRFRRPAPGVFDDPLTYASRGYFVLLPDIVHRPRDVGRSAVDCVEAAVRAVLRRNLVDPARIGLIGISLGGYETAFVLSKSKLFAAGVAASPPADWANDFLTGRRGNVQSEDFWLRSIGMTVPFWDDAESYVANSLLYQAQGITTPLLIGIGRQDPVVDCREGESIFHLLRYLKRPAYLVAYRHGGHGLGEDFSRRVGQFFGHHLKDEPQPDWIAGQNRR